MIKTINWIFLVAGTFMMMYFLHVTGKPLITADTPLGIIDLELASDAVATNRILAIWSDRSVNGTDLILQAIKHSWLDFIFLFFYSLLLFYSCKIISEGFTGTVHKIGRIMAIAALNAGLLDIAENAGMLLSLNDIITNGISLCTSIFSVLKWTMLLAVLIYIIVAGTLFIYRKYISR